MKHLHLYLSLGILLALLLLCIGSSCLVRTCTLRTAELLEAGEQAQSPDEQAAAMQAAAQYWQAHVGVLDSLLRHDEADQVLTELAQLLAYQANDETAEMQGTCASLILRLRHIADMELPLYYNLLTFLPESYSAPA